MSGQHTFVDTRTSPFGCYARCSCGWITPNYSPTHAGAYDVFKMHHRQFAAPVGVGQ